MSELRRRSHRATNRASRDDKERHDFFVFGVFGPKRLRAKDSGDSLSGQCYARLPTRGVEAKGMASRKTIESKTNVVTGWVGSTLLFVQNENAPTDPEWDEFLTILAENRTQLPKLRLLVVTSGGAPTTDQRKRLASTLAGTPMRVASVSNSMKIRFVTATISLFHSDFRTFSTSELEDAYDYLGLGVGERRQVAAAVKEMRARVL
jgi:hypothetical protein